MTTDELKIFFESTFVITNPKSGTSWNVKPADLPFASVMYLFGYGGDQQNDCHSGVKKENFTKNGVFDSAEWAKQSDAKLNARITKLREGNPPKRGDDATTAVARQLANAMSGLDQAQAAALVAKLVAEAKKTTDANKKKDAA